MGRHRWQLAQPSSPTNVIGQDEKSQEKSNGQDGRDDRKEAWVSDGTGGHQKCGVPGVGGFRVRGLVVFTVVPWSPSGWGEGVGGRAALRQ